MPNSITPLKITQDTTQAEVKDFLDQAGFFKKIYGVKDEQGNTTLYIGSSSNNLGDLKNPTGMTKAQRKKEAKDTLEKFFKGSDTQFGTSNLGINVPQNKGDETTIKGRLRRLFHNAVDTVLKRDGHGLKARHVKDLYKTGTDLKSRLQWRDTQMSKVRTQDLSQQFQSHTKQLNIKSPIQIKLDGAQTNFDAPHFEIGGKTYEPQSFLGCGGFGLVLRYECKDTGDTKAVKFVRPDTAQKMMDPTTGKPRKGNEKHYNQHVADIRTELKAGQMADGNSKAAVYTDFVKMDDNTFTLIGDDAALGDMHKFANSLLQLRAQNVMTPHLERLVNLTLMQDVTQGLQQLHNDQNATHGDMKPANLAINANGEGTLIDLGFTQKGDRLSPLKNDDIMYNMKYAAPETMDTAYAPDTADLSDVKKEFKALIKLGTHTGRNDARLNSLMANVQKDFTKAALVEQSGDYSIGHKADVFGVGVASYAMLQGKWASQELQDELGKNDYNEHLSELANDPDAKGVAPKVDSPEYWLMTKEMDSHAYAEATGDPVMDKFLNDCLNPNPDKRPTSDELLTHTAFNYGKHNGVDAIGSPEVRDFIKAIAGGNPSEINNAKIALLNAHPEPADI